MKNNIFKYTLAIAVMMLMTSCEKTSIEEYAQYMGWEVIDSGDDSEEDTDNDNQQPTDNKPTAHGDVVETGVVDLGLSVNWAACNLSDDYGLAENCADFGTRFTWSTYSIAYPPASISGTEADNVINLLGEGWRTPTKAEWDELRNKCYITYTSFRGKGGIKVTGPSNKTMFIPSTSDYYWTGSYDLDHGQGYCFDIDSYWSSCNYIFSTSAPIGNSYYIRPVCDK